MKKKDMILIAAVLAISLISFAAIKMTQKDGKEVIVTVEGKEVYKTSIKKDQIYQIPEENGTNVMQFGAPPHAGMAPGVDRMIMLLRNEENIREIIAFPMSGTAQDLMCGAPNEITEQQLREVHIKVRD